MAAAWSITVTLHAWWLLVYLLVGVVLWLPLEWLAYRKTYNPQGGFWRTLRVALHGDVQRVALLVVAWPFAIKEAI